MKQRLIFQFLVIASSFTFATTASAGLLLTADPDGIPINTDLTNQFNGVTLSVLELGAPSDLRVAASAFNPSTGDRSFSWIGPGSPPSSGGLFNSVFQMRIDFDSPVNFVAIDAIAATVQVDPGPSATLTSLISAFDSSGNFLGTTGLLFTAEMSNTAQTHLLTRGSYDISYITVRGSTKGPNFTYDNLRFNIPEPTSFCMLASGAFFMLRRRRINR